MYYSVQFEEFRRSEVRSKCTDRGSLGDRQAKVAVLFTAKMLCRTPKLPFRLRSQASGFIRSAIRSVHFKGEVGEVDIFFLTLRCRSSRPNYSIEVLRRVVRPYYSIGVTYF